MVGVQRYWMGYGLRKTYALFTTHYSITPILHLFLCYWLHPCGVKLVLDPLDPIIYFKSPSGVKSFIGMLSL
jgi:hypothetical protein